MPETIAALFFAHVLADYVFQSKSMVDNKRDPRVLLGHGAIVWLTAACAIGDVTAWPLLLYTGLHFATDVIKTRIPKDSDSATAYLADQSAHVVALIAIAAFAPDMWDNGAWGDMPAWLSHAMLAIAGLIYATRAGGFAIGAFMRPYGAALSAPQPAYDMAPNTASLPNAGQAIGMLERALIYVMIQFGLYTGIGFLIAAKSVLRFDATSDNRKAEYVIIGTLASFSWAIAVGIGVACVHATLPALGFSLPTP